MEQKACACSDCDGRNTYSTEDNNDISTESLWITTIKCMRAVTIRWVEKSFKQSLMDWQFLLVGKNNLKSSM